MPNFVYSLAGTVTALALSLVIIYHLDKNFVAGQRENVSVNDATVTTSEIVARTVPTNAMKPRSAGAPAAPFSEFSRVDLQVPTIGAYKYEPSAEIRAAATKHQTATPSGQREWYTLGEGKRIRPAPVVILFHGANRTGLSMLDMWEAVARKSGVVLLAPNSVSTRWPYQQPDSAFLERMLDEVATTTPIDRTKVFLFGHSSGGVYAQILVNRRIGPWRAAATHGGFATSEYLTPAADAKPLRMYIGSLEQSFPVGPARQMGQFLAEAGHQTDLVVIPFQTHWFYDSGPNIAEDAWKWFDAL